MKLQPNKKLYKSYKEYYEDNKELVEYYGYEPPVPKHSFGFYFFLFLILVILAVSVFALYKVGMFIYAIKWTIPIPVEEFLDFFLKD